MNKPLGDQGEATAARLLRERGYSVREIGGNFPVIDLIVTGESEFRVSVKTSASKQHVRMGRESSVARLLDQDFVFAFMPATALPLDLSSGIFRLFILPGRTARCDALHVHQTYLATRSRDGEDRTGVSGIIVKGYSRRPAQAETWKRWQFFENRWDLLPKACTEPA